MGNQLTPEQIDEIVKALQNLGNKEMQTSQEAAEERNLLVTNLKCLNGKFFTSMQHGEVFKLGFEVGMLTKHSYSAIRDQALIVLRELLKNTEDYHSKMGNQLTPEQIDEIVKALQNIGNKEMQTSQEVAEERNMLMTNLKRLNGKFFTSMQHGVVFKLGVIIGQLSRHFSSAVRDQAIIVARGLLKETEDNHQASDSKPMV